VIYLTGLLGERVTMATDTNEQLASSVRAELERDTRVDLRNARVEVSAQEDRVRLEGEVPDIVGKRIAANLTRQLAGDAAEVEDLLCVQTETVGDGELADRGCEHLMREGAFRETAIALELDDHAETLQDPPGSEHTIEVGVDAGGITLRGTVGSLTHRRLAEVICWRIPGCRRVDNQLRIDPPQSDSDNLLADAVRMVLEKDPLVDAGQVRAGSAAGIVELDGMLSSEEAHHLAVRDIWAIPGVWEVDDRLHTELA
jgi:osmotically-inducible protein OsmY